MNERDIYLRFVTFEVDGRTESAKGLFSAAYDLLRTETIQEYESAEIKRMLVWFEKNLPTPTKFSRKKNVSQRETKGLSWIKSSATELVSNLYALKEIVERHGIHCEVLKTKTPGYIVYEDDLQVVAEPFRKLA